MKILVSGGAGFIGHNVVRKLEAMGHVVYIIDNQNTYGGLLDNWDLEQLMKERLKDIKAREEMRFQRADIAWYNSKAYIYNFDPDIIIHLAAYPRAKVVNANPVEGVETMSVGLTNLLTAGATCNIKRFVYISSSMVYGDWEGGITERATCKPGSIYASMKLAGEQITKQIAKNEGFEYTIVRPSAVYGPRDVEDRVVSKFLLNAMRNETLYVHGEDETLDFTYVDDIANGIVLAALEPAAANETFNMTRGRAEFLDDAAHLMTTIVNKGTTRIVGRNTEMPSRGFLRIEKARKLLGYDPKYTIEDGFKAYYDWAKQFYSI